MLDTIVREAASTDRDAVHALLGVHRLPVPRPDDVPVRFLVAERDGEIVGVCGWEVHGPEALLRSVAVAVQAGGSGTGTLLVTEALRRLDAAGFPRIVLVTLDAAAFFARFAFAPIDRGAVPGPVRKSTEYALHECAGGQWMVRERTGPGR